MSGAGDGSGDRDRDERRAAPRGRANGALKLDLTLEEPSEVLLLSTLGMMVRLAFPLPLGTSHAFTLSFDSRALRVRGIVRNTHEATPPAQGHEVGLEFENVTDADREFLESFVAERLKS